MEIDRKQKYTRKLKKCMQKWETCEDDRNGEMKGKIEKYQRKLEAFEKESNDVRVREVDKSGMTLLLFYGYVEPAWSSSQHSEAIRWAQKTLEKQGVTGRLRVAREGFNGTLTGSYDGIREFTSQLRKYHDGYFANMNDIDDLKYTDNLPIGQTFPKLKVFAVSELVNYGLGIENAPSIKNGGIHLDPSDYNKKLQEPNTVVIDVRNSYEADIGRFAPRNGAEYIDPEMRVSTEFPGWVRDNLDKIRDKQVLMYCTGGIRCERASALVKSMGVTEVYQLKGGIHNYLAEYADKGGGLWVGENYTFDKRFAHGVKTPSGTKDEAIDNTIAESSSTNDRGIKEKPHSLEMECIDNPDIVGRCTSCSIPWSKYRGRKRCPVCGVPLLLCTSCIKNKMDKRGAKCPLCQKDNKLGKAPFNKKKHYEEIRKNGGVVNEGEEDDWDEDRLGGGVEEVGEGEASCLGKRSFSSSSTRTKTRTSKSGGGNMCGVCNEDFKSRNALFKHINETGHANRKSKKR